MDRRSALAVLLPPAFASLWRRRRRRRAGDAHHPHRHRLLGEPGRRAVLAPLDLVASPHRHRSRGPGRDLPAQPDRGRSRPHRGRAPSPRARPPGRRADLERALPGLRLPDQRRDRDAGSLRGRPGALGPPRPGARRARLAPDRRAHEPASAGLQHLLPAAARLQRRAREDHARGHGSLRDQGHQDLAVRRSRGAQPAPAHHARRGGPRARAAATPARRVRGRHRDHARAPQQLEPPVGPADRPGRRALQADVARGRAADRAA